MSTGMSNLKNHFTSKLTSVIVTEKKGAYVYTASFQDGTTAVIRTSSRKYVSVTQISCDNHFVRDEAGNYSKADRTDFLFSAKPTASLGKSELHRVLATVQVTTGAPVPPVAPKTIKLGDLLDRESASAGFTALAAASHVPPAPQPVVAPEPAQQACAKGEKTFDHQGRTFTIAPDFKGTHGWRWYLEDGAQGRSIRSDRAYLCEERAIFEAKLYIDQQACAELAKYQPKIVLDAITGALQKPPAKPTFRHLITTINLNEFHFDVQATSRLEALEIAIRRYPTCEVIALDADHNQDLVRHTGALQKPSHENPFLSQIEHGIPCPKPRRQKPVAQSCWPFKTAAEMEQHRLEHSGDGDCDTHPLG